MFSLPNTTLTLYSLYTASSGVVTTLAGSGTATWADGTGTSASFNYPTGVAVSPNGLTVYVADQGNTRIRSVTSELVLVLLLVCSSRISLELVTMHTCAS